MKMVDHHFPGSNLDQKIRRDFEDAYSKGFRHMLRSWFAQRSTRLLSFDEVRIRLPVRGTHYLGVREIPVDQIVGSVARYQDFDNYFLPLHTHTRSRWERIDRAHLTDVILPPIEVYKLGAVYFVKDGNHRVSVARERGQVYVDAYVVEMDIAGEFHAGDNVDDVIRKAERADFEECTVLKRLYPDADINLTLPAGYGKLLEHIRVHRWFMGEERKARVSWKNAVGSWYEEVYLPLVCVIRENQILKEFPKRTEADLYLWIIEHLWYLKEEADEEVPLEAAAKSFAEKYATRTKCSIRDFFQRIFYRRKR